MRDFEKHCPHEKIPHPTHSDYHPLTEEEVIGLLDLMKDATDNDWSEALVRLTQAIPGMTCPRPGSGEVMRKQLTLEIFLVNRGREGPTAELVRDVLSMLG